MDPRIWGPDVWRAIHHLALGYPLQPTDQDKADYRTFFVALGAVLPCASCAANYQRHLRELPLEPALDQGGRALFEWTVAMHNLVNVESGKPQRTPDQVLTRLALDNRATLLSAGGAQALGLGGLMGIAISAAAVYAWLRLGARRVR